MRMKITFYELFWEFHFRSPETANQLKARQLNSLKRAALKRGGGLCIQSAYNSRIILTISHPLVRRFVSAGLSAAEPTNVDWLPDETTTVP